MTPEKFEQFIDPVDGTRWNVDMGFLSSSWRCVWGEGCQGILDDPAEDLQQGCCSVGVELFDEEEAMLISALAPTIDPSRWQFAETAAEFGIFRDDKRNHTALVDGACIFLNRVGFEGGAGCALHLQAEADGERPMDWKPAVCWQLPLRAEGAGGDVATLRRWTRADWGTDATMAWCCTEEAAAFVGDKPVAESLAGELEALVGPEVAVMITQRASLHFPADSE
jgi:hypothetical protein